jgi:hypothetical protein
VLNHFRTLLVNWAGSQSPPEVPGAELVEPAFQPVELPTALQTVRAALFGQSPDLAMLNYRARQLLCLVHASPLEGHVFGLDPRVSYDFGDDSLAQGSLYAPRVNALAGAGNLAVFGRPAPPDVTGRMRHLLAVRVESAGSVRVTRLSPPASNLLFSPGPDMPLAGTGYSFWVDPPAAGQVWQVEVYNRPQAGLGGLADAAAKVGEPTLDHLFGVTKDEPYHTWRGLWFSDRELPLRLAALACALVYRTEERRVSGG